MTGFTLITNSQTFGAELHREIPDLAEVSRVYCKRRGETGEGASTFRDGIVRKDNRRVYRVSYNGRIWELDSEYRPETEDFSGLVYCPCDGFINA